MHTTILRLCGICLGQPGWADARRNIHPLTPIMVINCPLYASSIYYDPWHPPCSIHAPDNLFPQSLQVFFGLPLGLPPSTSYSIHFFTQSLSSFRNTRPYHRNVFHCSTEIMSSNPSLCLNSLLGILSCSFMPHIHLTILISACWSAAWYFFLMGQSPPQYIQNFQGVCECSSMDPISDLVGVRLWSVRWGMLIYHCCSRW